MEANRINELVEKCLRDLLMQETKNTDAVVDQNTRLLGRNAVLDSLGLVSLIVDVEQRMALEHNVAITIADERAMSQKHSPFLTVGTLSSYVWTLTLEQQVGHV